MSDDFTKKLVSDCVTQARRPLEFEDWRAGISERMILKRGQKWCAVIDSASDPDLPALLWAFQEDADIWPLFMNF